MRRANLIQAEQTQIETVEDLTDVFESIASTQVAKVKDKVKLSKDFFDLLWQRYTSIRIDPDARFASRKDDNTKNVFVIISAEAGLSGDIDQRLLETMLVNYNRQNTDIVVIGSHGANLLQQKGIPIKKFFQVPESDEYIDVSPVINAIHDYSEVIVYYEEYVSLGVQNIKTMDLFSSIQEMSAHVDESDQTMSTKDTIFEPSLDEIADIMEETMMVLAFSQAILESSLAQAASRFNAMASAKKRAFELVSLFKLDFHRAKRSESDRRLREVLVSIKKKKRRAGVNR